jgi:hypothetical protein
MGFLTGSILDGALAWLTKAVFTALQGVFAIIHNLFLVSPDLTGLPQFQALTGRSVGIVDAVFVLFFLAAGIITMISGGGERARYTVKDLIPRCVVGFIAAHFSNVLVHNCTVLANGITAAIVPGNTDDGTAALEKNITQMQTDFPTDALMVVLLVVVCVLFVAVEFQALARIMALMVLTAIAPLALAMHALPQTDPAARMWWRSFASCLTIPMLQAVLLTAGQWVLLDPKTQFGLIGLPVEPGITLNLFIVIVLLGATVKIPKMMRKWAGQTSGGGGSLASVVRVLIVGAATKAIPGAGKLVRKAAR